jgi:hypothetical protein
MPPGIELAGRWLSRNAAIVLLGGGLFGLGVWRRRRRS